MLTLFGLSCGRSKGIRNFGSAVLTQAAQEGRQKLSAATPASVPGLPSSVPEEVRSGLLPSRNQGQRIQGMLGLKSL